VSASLAGQLHDAKSALREAKAVVETMKAREASGELIDRKALNDRTFACVRSIRDRLLNSGARHAAVIAAQHSIDPFDLASKVDAHMARICDELADQASNPVIARALRTDPVLTVSEWAERHRKLSTRSAAEPGPYRVSRTPYIREIMDCLSVTSPVQRVVFKKPSQIGGTETGNCWLGYIIHHAPGPVMAVQPTVELAKRFSKQRIDPLIADSPVLSERVSPARERDSGNTMLMKEFPGGCLVITGANSAVGLRSMPARFEFMDEVDAYPPDVDGEGDPISLAEARSETFGFRAKALLTSTPLMKGTSVISAEYERSDQRKYFVPCPHCTGEQVLEFKQLRYERRPIVDKASGEETIAIENCFYECAICQGHIEEHHKTEMLARGKWHATSESADPHTRGYHINGLYSPVGWLSWEKIAWIWENKARKSAEARKVFTNTILAEEWEEEADAIPDWRRLYDRREDWPHATVPERGLFLTAGVDVQANRIEADVWAWGRHLESWLVEHLVFDGDTSRPEVWTLLTEFLSRTWPHASGKRIALRRVAIDTGAFTRELYAWVRQQDRRLVLAVKGAQTERSVPVAGPTYIDITEGGRKIKRGVTLWIVSGGFFKNETYKFLRLTKPTDEELAEGARFPQGYLHLSTAAGDEWCKQLVAEQQVIVRARNGFALRTEWRPLRPRNEALDCRVYARAAAWREGVDRWSEAKWREAEKELDLEPPPPEPPAEAAQPAPQQAAAAPPGPVVGRTAPPLPIRKRRVLH